MKSSIVEEEIGPAALCRFLFGAPPATREQRETVGFQRLLRGYADISREDLVGQTACTLELLMITEFLGTRNQPIWPPSIWLGEIYGRNQKGR